MQSVAVTLKIYELAGKIIELLKSARWLQVNGEVIRVSALNNWWH